jgi:hypothetical protein
VLVSTLMQLASTSSPSPVRLLVIDWIQHGRPPFQLFINEQVHLPSFLRTAMFGYCRPSPSESKIVAFLT